MQGIGGFMSNKLKYVQRFQAKASIYKKQFASITILTAVMMFGFQNCAKAPMNFESDKLAQAAFKSTDTGITAEAPQIAVGDAVTVNTQIVCEAGGMFVDPVAGHCPEGAVDISGGSGSSSGGGSAVDPSAGSGGTDVVPPVVTEPPPVVVEPPPPVVVQPPAPTPVPVQPPSSDVLVDIPSDDVEVAVDASGSQASDLGECLVPQLAQHLQKNLKLKIVLHLPILRISVGAEALVQGWLDGILNNLRKENGALLSYDEKKDILTRLKLSVASQNLPDLDSTIHLHRGRGFFLHPLVGILKVKSMVKFHRGSGERCEGLDSIKPKLKIKVKFHGIAQALHVHRHHGDHAEDVLEGFGVEVDKDSSDPDNKILSVDLDQLAGVSKLRLSCDKH
jgi:hypothetical protein